MKNKITKTWRPMRLEKILKDLPPPVENSEENIDKLYHTNFLTSVKKIHGKNLHKISKKILKDIGNNWFYGIDGYGLSENNFENFVSGNLPRQGKYMKLLKGKDESYRIEYYTDNQDNASSVDHDDYYVYYIDSDKSFSIGSGYFIMGYVE